MLQIYSDASFWQGTSYAASLILEDNERCLAFLCHKYENLESCTVGEIMGVIQGLEWVVSNHPDASQVTLYVDNLSVGQKLCNYVQGGVVKKGAYPALWMRIYTLCDAIPNIQVYHITSHQHEHNPNKACDMLCTALLRPYKEGKEPSGCTLLSPQG